MKKILIVLILAVVMSGCGETHQQCHEEYYFTEWGSMYRAGKDLDTAVKMAAGEPVFLREKCVDIPSPQEND